VLLDGSLGEDEVPCDGETGWKGREGSLRVGGVRHRETSRVPFAPPPTAAHPSQGLSHGTKEEPLGSPPWPGESGFGSKASGLVTGAGPFASAAKAFTLRGA